MFVVSLKDEEYFDSKREIFDKLLNTAFSNARKLSSVLPWKDGTWKICNEEGSCRVWSKDVGFSDFKVFQGALIVKTKRKVEEIADIVQKILIVTSKDHEKIHRKAAEEMLEQMIIMHIKQYFAVCYLKMKSPNRLVYPRDLIVIRNFFFEDDEKDGKCCYIVSRSIPQNILDDDKESKKRVFPDGDGYVRSTMYLNCMKIKRISPESVVFQSISHVSPGGWIPPLLFNMLAGNACLSIKTMADGMKKFLEGDS